MEKSYIVHNLGETEELAKKLSLLDLKGKCLLLNGDLGAGKTTFTKFLLKYLGVKSIVSSPTFTILNEYSGNYPIYHFDMYRITSPDELYELGFEDYLTNKKSQKVISGLKIIEWGENVKEILPKNSIDIDIEKIDDTTRRFTIKGEIWNY